MELLTWAFRSVFISSMDQETKNNDCKVDFLN